MISAPILTECCANSRHDEVDLTGTFQLQIGRDPVHHKTRSSDARDIARAPAISRHPTETRALLALIERLKPGHRHTHAARLYDDAGGSLLGHRLAERCQLPLLKEIGYPTPGSMGTWASEQKLTLVTWELEAASLYDLKDHHVPILLDLMTRQIEIDT